MTKTEAVRLFGGRPTDRLALGVTRQAVQGWPEQLTPKTSPNRVQAALWRVAHGIKAEAKAGA
ncbi:MAG: hypothetical protein IPL77_10970 [Flavobacteriales bacterium]|nr:hypothetical protein [Flavobacteriales bacterium]